MANIPAELMQQFLRVDKRYSINPNEEPFFDMPASLKLDKLEYVAPSEEEVRQQVYDKLKVSYDKAVNTAEQTYQKSLGRIEVKRQKAQSSLENSNKKADEALRQNKIKIKDEAQKRGLCRSSVYNNLIAKAEQDTAQYKERLQSDFEVTLTGLAAEEDYALQTKNTALDYLKENFDNQLKQEVIEQIAAVESKKESVIKYNNTQEEKELTYKRTWSAAYLQAQQSHTETAMRLQAIATDKGYSVIQDYIYQDKATFAKDYYLAFDAVTAYNAFMSAQVGLLEELSVTYFNQVKEFLQERL